MTRKNHGTIGSDVGSSVAVFFLLFAQHTIAINCIPTMMPTEANSTEVAVILSYLLLLPGVDE